MSWKRLALLVITGVLAASGFSFVATGDGAKPIIRPTALWKRPDDIQTRNLFYGPGGEAGQPKGPFNFIEEDHGGTSPKFVVKDSRGVRWKVKLGPEAIPDTAATRLLWAVGYYVDVNYYLPQVQVSGLPKLSRGQKYVSPDGTVRGARLERTLKKSEDWSWFDNPFVGTREFNGLRVMMAFMNKWDLKQQNNAVYDQRDQEQHYFVSDLGDTFGKTGSILSRSKGNVRDFVKSKFIDHVSGSNVDLVMHSRPPILCVFNVPYYVERTRMEKVSEHIPRADARWIGQWLARLSNNQLADAFRAAGFTSEEVNAYVGKLRERINQLNEL
ncbi:MAG TPA: hypothetical protein VFV34_29575 [Blastocatellia bacterium]|nr:hypothetical protein [Blastocatellia bacterium]